MKMTFHSTKDKQELTTTEGIFQAKEWDKVTEELSDIEIVNLTEKEFRL